MQMTENTHQNESEHKHIHRLTVVCDTIVLYIFFLFVF